MLVLIRDTAEPSSTSYIKTSICHTTTIETICHSRARARVHRTHAKAPRVPSLSTTQQQQHDPSVIILCHQQELGSLSVRTLKHHLSSSPSISPGLMLEAARPPARPGQDKYFTIAALHPASGPPALDPPRRPFPLPSIRDGHLIFNFLPTDNPSCPSSYRQGHRLALAGHTVLSL